MGSALPTTPTTTTRMAQVQGNNLLDVLKKKMRQTKEEMEKYKEESEDMARKLQVEIRRREEAEGEVAALNRRIQLLEELRVVGNNLKSLEVSEEKASKKEESFSTQLRTLTAKCKEAEARAEFAERSVTKLQKEVDRLEDDLLGAKEKNKKMEEEMEAAFQDIQNM